MGLDPERARKEIAERNWYVFGRDVPSECHGITGIGLWIYEDAHVLLPPCDSCYKTLIFWEPEDFDENVVKLGSVLEGPLLREKRGKFNEGVVVVYSGTGREAAKLADSLRATGITGRVDWRRACAFYQQYLPELWKSDKIFSPKKY
jgi:hypothetical protein